MNIIEICGKRGLGDLISGLSLALQHIKQPSHLKFNYLPGRGYEAAITTLMCEFETRFQHTFEINHDWYTVDFNVAEKRFGKENYKKTWYFTNCYSHQYTPFKSRWLGNIDGPIALAINNENTNENYPYPGKWFDPTVNNILKNLIDEKKYLFLGRPYSVSENIEKLSRCRYALGVDGAWAHACNAIGIPYYLVRNNLETSIIESIHRKHPTLKTIETHSIFNFLF